MIKNSLVGAAVVSALAICSSSLMAADRARVEVVENTDETTVLRYQFAPPTLRKVHVGDEVRVVVELGDESIAVEAGQPAIADVRRSIMIGDNAQVEAVMTAGDFVEMSGIEVAPSKGTIYRTVDPATVPYSFGKEFETNELWPAQTVELGDPYIMRNIRGVVVDVNPIQYNPVTKTLRVYRNMEVAVRTIGVAEGEILGNGRAKKVDGSAFHGIYKNHFVNYSRDLRYDPIESEGEILVICHDPWMSNMQPFVDHKISIGIPTTMVSISSVGNSPTSIMDYVTSMYSAMDLVYVVLVGDIAQIATPRVTFENGASDPSYALMTADTYPDLIVSRFSAESAADVDVQVQRVLTFETENWTQDSKYWRALGIGSNEGAGIGDDGESDIEHASAILADLQSYGFTSTVGVYDPTGSVSDCVAELNEGIGTISYTGHGSTQCFGNGCQVCISDINGLTNTEMYPWIISVACVNGQFDAGTCFAEAWMRATHNGLPSGAAAIYASSVNQSWAPPMSAQDEVYDLFVSETYSTLGALCYAGSCLMMDEYGAAGVEMYETWHIFGDASLRVVGITAPPTGMGVTGSGFSASGANGGPFSPSSVDITITNHDIGPGLSYSASTATTWLQISGGSGVIPVGGQDVFTVSIDQAYAATLGNGPYAGSVDIDASDGSSVSLSFDLEVGSPEPVYVFDFETDPNWSTEGEWAFGVPSGQGGGQFGNPDPSSGYVGSNVYGVDLSGDYDGSVGGPWHLTTTALDCSSLTDVRVEFQRWLNTDYAPYASASLQASNDGVSWSDIWSNGSSEVADSSWQAQSFDLSAVADGQETVYLRWSYSVGSNAWLYSGWNIDEVVIWGLVPESGPACPTDLNGNGVTDVNDLLSLLAGYGTPDGDVTGDGETNVDDVLAILAVYGDPC